MEEAREQRVNSKVPSKFISRLLEIILQYSIFEFNENVYQQQIGTSMGTKPAPEYANKFLAKKVDKKFWEIAEKYQENDIIPMKFIKRFFDDLFLIFLGSIAKLHAFLKDINQIHPTIKFTVAHTTPKN